MIEGSGSGSGSVPLTPDTGCPKTFRSGSGSTTLVAAEIIRAPVHLTKMNMTFNNDVKYRFQSRLKMIILTFFSLQDLLVVSWVSGAVRTHGWARKLTRPTRPSIPPNMPPILQVGSKHASNQAGKMSCSCVAGPLTWYIWSKCHQLSMQHSGFRTQSRCPQNWLA